MEVIRFSDLNDEARHGSLLRRQPWEELLARSGNRSIFMTWEWLSTWWEIFGGDHELWWLIVKGRDGNWIGGAPLYLRRYRNGLLLPYRELRFVGTGASVGTEHMDVVADPNYRSEALQALTVYLAEHASRWDVLCMTDISNPEALVYQITNHLAGRDMWVHVGEQLPKAVYVPLPSTWDEYFKSLGKWLRQTISRQRRKLLRELGLNLYVWSEKDSSLDSALDELERLFRARKSALGVSNKFQSAPGYREFHRRLMARFFERGWLYLAFLKDHERAVAVEYTFKYGDVLYSYQSGFDPEFGRRNVFKVLRSYVIEEAIRQGIREFDLLRGDESYKYDWKAVDRKKQTIRAFSSTFYGRALGTIAGVKRRLKEVVAQGSKKYEA
ncbi:MAG: GNAT family N-acetyltransferase [Candidatus Omnitrophica bacterium]|nr:GNAT family N-acetyltransferase [Candidatus Omnitrophota bacterium]